MVMRTLAAAGNLPTKKEVKKSETPWVIKFKGEVYRIRKTELKNLGLDYLNEIREFSAQRGLDPWPEYSAFCLFCNNNTNNVVVMMGGENVDETGKKVTNCHCAYESKENVSIASSWQDRRNGREFMALSDDCVFYDALVSVLHKKGVLEPYRITEDFHYRSIDDFGNGLADPRDFQVKSPTLYGRLKGIFYRLRR